MGLQMLVTLCFDGPKSVAYIWQNLSVFRQKGNFIVVFESYDMLISVPYCKKGLTYILYQKRWPNIIEIKNSSIFHMLCYVLLKCNNISSFKNSEYKKTGKITAS